MDACAIVREHNLASRQGWTRLQASHAAVGNKFALREMRATEPAACKPLFDAWGLRWTYPWDESRFDPVTRLTLRPYRTKTPAARVACFLSHFKLWLQSAERGENLIILEDDAVWINRLEPADYVTELAHCGAIGLNDPRGATRRAEAYHKAIQAGPRPPVVPAPAVDEITIPQGLAGNSAYMISPGMAERLLAKVREVGAWPNDALMCRQLFPGIGVTTRYYTRVSGRPSSLA